MVLKRNILIRVLTIIVVLLFTQLRLYSQYTVSSTETDASCNGGSDGTVTTTVAGGTANYTYYLYMDISGNYDLVGTPVVTSTPFYIFTNLSAGKYEVEVSDNSLPVNDEFGNIVTINQPAALDGGIIALNQIICSNPGNPSGFTSTTDPSGGSGTWTYDWEWSLNSSFSPTNSLGVNSLTCNPPGGLTATTYYRRKATRGICGTVYSDNYITVTVNNPPTSGGTIAPAIQTICPGTLAAPFTSTVDASGGTSPSYVWQYSTTSSVAGSGTWTNIPSSNSNTLTYSTPISVQTYFVRQYFNTCGLLYSNVVTVNVYATSNPGTIASAVAQACAPVNLPFTSTAPASGGQSAPVYQWQYNTTGTWINIPGANAATYTATSVTQTTSYQRTATMGCGTVNSNVLTINISNMTTPSIAVTNPLSCFNSSDAQFTATVSGGIPPYTYVWEQSSSGLPGGPWIVVGGNSNILSGIGQGLYQVIVSDVVGCPPVSKSILFIFGAPGMGGFIPADVPAPTASNQNQCFNNTVANLVATPPSNCIVQWFTTATGGVALSPATVLSAGTYYAQSQNTISGCTSSLRTAVVVTIIPIPTITSTTPGSNCGPGTVTLGAAASAGIINWWAAAVGGVSLGTGPSFTTPVLASTTTYYVDATNLGCTTAARTAVTATINPVPTITSTTPGSNCGPGAVTLGATASAGIINWWAAAVGGVSLGTGPSFTTPVIAGTTTYYVDATLAGCTTTTRTAVVATITPIPTITGTTPGSNCGPGAVTLGATASAGLINWWAAAVGGVSLGTGPSFTTPVIASTTTYYVDATIAGCTTAARTAVVATITPIPTITSTTPGSNCGPGTVTLGATASAGIINWWAAAVGGVSLGTGPSFITPVLAGTTTYYVDATIAGCTTAARTAVTATINPIPTITSTTPGSNCGPGAVTLGATASAGIINWWAAAVGGVSLGTGPSFTTPVLLNTTTYYVDATNAGCTTTTRTAIVATITPIPTITSTTPGSNCGPGAVTLGATASAGIINWWAGAVGGVSLGTGPSFTTPILASTTTYYVDATNTGCTTAARTAVTATINPVPAITGTTPGSNCGPGAVTLGATASAGIINWWAAATGGVSLGTGPSFTTPVIAGTTTYYVDATLAGCTTTTRTAVVATITPIPTITGTTPGSNCGPGAVTLGATASAGLINWWAAAVGGVSLGTGPSFTTPVIASTTTYYVDATIAGCTTAARTAVVATITPIPTITSTTPGSNCGPGTVTLGATASAGIINWWAAAVGGVSLGTGPSFITPVLAGTTTYYVDATIAGCTTAARTAVTATINPIPTITSTTPGSNCGPGAVTLGATASAGIINWWAAATGGVSLGTGPSFTTPILASTTTYYVDATIAGCTTAARTAITATITPIPTITSTTPGSNCGPGAVTLGATASAGIINWWAGAVGGVSLGTGPSFTTPVLASTTTYYIDATNLGCTTAARTAVTATINPVPTITSTTPGSNCGPGAVTLGATASAGIINWWAAATGGVSLGTGPSFTTPVIAGTTTYYVDATLAGCTTATRTAVVATITPIPTITGTTPGSNCGPGAVTLGATASAGLINWWAAAVGGVSLGTGPSFTTPVIASTTTYYVDATIAGCTTAARTAVVATITPIPTITSTTPGSNCGPGAVTLGATASAGIINWWAAAVGGVSLGTGPSFITPVLAGTTTYYVDATIAGCTTAARTAVTATINPIPTITSTTPGSNCGPGAVTLGATASAGIINWWAAATGGVSLGTGPSFTTPVLLNTTTYYVDATNAGCTTTTRTAIVATITPIPTITGTTPGSNCGPGAVTLGATASAGIINWWAAAVGGVSLGTGPSFTTPVLASTTTYYVDATIAGCTTAARTAVTATINPVPTITSTTPGSNCGPGAVTLGATASAGIINWWAAATGGVSLGTGPSFTTPVIAGTTTYYVDATLAGCTTTTRTAVVATINPDATAYAGANDSICHNDNIVLSDATASNYSSLLWTTSGDGTFTNAAILNTIYTPGPNDQLNGSVVLTLTASSAICPDVFSSKTVTITSTLVATVGSLTPYLIGAGTTIEIGISVNNRAALNSLGFYFVSPDGTIVTLHTNDFLCYSFASSAKVVFTTKLPASQTYDICSPQYKDKPLTGTFGAVGDWTALYGKDPANGAWRVEVTDCDNAFLQAGDITNAYIEFKDVDSHGDSVTVNYDSGNINFPINQSEDAFTCSPTDYIVPIGLKTKCSNCGPGQGATAVLTKTGGTAPYKKGKWYNQLAPSTLVATGDTVELCSGNYFAIVTDELGCIDTAFASVSSPLPINIDSIKFSNGDSLKCFGDTTSIQAYLSGGTGLKEFTINGVTKNSGQTVSGLTKGIYTLHIFDDNGCNKDTTIKIVQPTMFFADSLKVFNVTCNLAGDGKIKLKGHKGTRPYNFVLEQGGVDVGSPVISNDSAVFSGLSPANNYMVVATDNNGCNADTFNIVITQPAVLAINTIDTSNYICFGQSNGFIRFTNVSGGTRPYLYSIDGGTTWQPDSSFTNLNQGPYNLTVKDSNNCPAAFPVINLKGANKLSIDSSVVNNVTICYNNPNGSIKIYASGGNGMLTFSLDTMPYQADSTFTGLLGGIYTTHVRDTLTSCTATGTDTIKAPPAVIIDSAVTVNVHGAVNGSCTVYAKGGKGPLNYSIDGINYQKSDTFLNLSAAKYYVYVHDSLGCAAALDSFYISNLTVTVTTINVICKGDSTGSITLTVAGSAKCKYSINGGSTFQDSGKFINLLAGTYLTEVVDTITGAKFFQSDTITQPAVALKFGFISPTNPTCFNGNNGSIRVTATGIPQLQFSINDSAYSTNFQFFNLSAGNYLISVMDGNGCQKTTEKLLVDPKPIDITASITNIIGFAKGSIQILTVKNGIPPYQFSINGGSTWQSDSTFSNLNAGIYTITTQDSNYICSHDTSLRVKSGDTLFVVPVVTNINCFGDSSGIISLTMGDTIYTNPLTFIIKGPGSDSIVAVANDAYIFPNLPGGNYLVTVTDAKGAEYLNIITIKEPQKLVIIGDVADASCNYQKSDGSITTIINGGTAPYSYLWNNSSATDSLTGIPMGHYTLFVIDADSCRASQAFTVNAKDTLKVSAGPSAQICQGVPYQLNASGSAGYSWSWTPLTGLSNSFIQNPMLTTTSNGRYQVAVTDTQNCTDTASVLIAVYTNYNLQVGIETSTGFKAINKDFVDVNIPVQLEALPDSFNSYQWTPTTYLDNPASRTPIINVKSVPSGDSIEYVLVAETSNGCQQSDSIDIIVRSHGLIPTGIYPGSKHYEDQVWFLEKAPDYPDILVEVYNRWGELVYMSTGYDNSTRVFDGKRNGYYLPAGTYYFVIDFKDGTTPETGSVTIVSTGK